MGIFNFKKRSKYGNKKVVVDGETFDSKKEKARYDVLKLAEEAGVIENLSRQVKFELIPAIREEYVEQLKTKTRTKTRTLQKAITYTADFEYYHVGRDEWVVSDVKASPKQSALDKCYILKKKLMFAIKGIKVVEVYKANDAI